MRAAPVIISSTPARDRAAYEQGDDELTDADWRVLEHFGPKPIWQQITGSKWRRQHPTTAPTTNPTTRKHAKHRPHELQAAAASQAALAEAPPTTEPAAVNA